MDTSSLSISASTSPHLHTSSNNNANSSSRMMAPPTTTSLFQVYLRLRPPMTQNGNTGTSTDVKSQQQSAQKQSSQQQQQQQPQQPWLIVEPPSASAPSTPMPMSVSGEVNGDYMSAGGPVASSPTHITLQPPNESRKRAIERFGFTKIFSPDASQVDLFQQTGLGGEVVKNVLTQGRDGLVATLGVTGSGKSHTIFGTKQERGLTQMTLDVLFRSIGTNIRRPDHPDLRNDTNLLASLQFSDASEAQITPASGFLDSIYASGTDGDRARMSRAQTPMTGISSRAQTPMTDIPSRKPPLPRPSLFAQIPDVSSFAIDVEANTEYAVLVSMYEVYNDRIFDLLSVSPPSHGHPMSTRQGMALQKGLMRRPLLFKNTEASPDRKLVAGLRKVICGSYDEAMMVLETGLNERRVAGTGSNSVSSRSHGFFCVEVLKRSSVNNSGLNLYYGDRWTGGTLSIVDLAGSERARNAKTTGSTLAEAGKINESLMYLGQCLQVQSDCQQDGSKPIVPFRQCKLTELLFSNSFPSNNHPTSAGSYRTPQRAVMIVAADPAGDFNATSQILRYSALAREVTVPRIPSVTSAMGAVKAGPQPVQCSPVHNNAGDRNVHNGADHNEVSHHQTSIDELENAHHEIERLTEECNTLSIRLAEEEIRRTEAELKLQATEEKVLATEQAVREEVWAEMESMMETERQRWREAWEAERLSGMEYLDGKIEILAKSQTLNHDLSPNKTRSRSKPNQPNFTIHEDEEDEYASSLERENEVLQAKLDALERELQQRSPTKSKSKPKSKTTTRPQTPQPQQSPTKKVATVKALKTRDDHQYVPASPFLLSLESAVGGEEPAQHVEGKISLRFPLPPLSTATAIAAPAGVVVSDHEDGENEGENEMTMRRRINEISPRKLSLRNSNLTSTLTSTANVTRMSSLSQQIDLTDGDENRSEKDEVRTPGTTGTTGGKKKTMRKLTTRKWDVDGIEL